MVYVILAAILLSAALFIAEYLYIKKYQKRYSMFADVDLEVLKSSLFDDLEDSWDYLKSLRYRAVLRELKKRNQKGSTT